MTKTCKSCRWWDNHGSDDAEECAKLSEPLFGGVFGDCCDEGTIYSYPDFGCIHWQQKEFPMEEK